MIDWILIFISIIPAVLYVGFFAYSVPSVPLTVIVVSCLIMMVYSFYTDMQPSNAAHHTDDQ